jgi:RNA polymerase-binding transcription factor DksA
VTEKKVTEKKAAEKKVVTPVKKQDEVKAKEVKKTKQPEQAKVVTPAPKKEKAPAVKKLKKGEKPVIEEDPNKEVVTTSVSKSELARIKSTVVEPPVKQQGRLLTNKKEEATDMLSVKNEKTRYSDPELEEFRVLISGKLEDAKSELKYLQEQISRTSEMGDDSDSRFKGLEDGTSTAEREYLSQMASRQIQYISHLEKAMIRIQNKTYGICRETGKLISKERLRAVPHATLSIEAKNKQG